MEDQGCDAPFDAQEERRFDSSLAYGAFATRPPPTDLVKEGMGVTRIQGTVLIIDAGTTLNDPANQPGDFLGYLDDADRARILYRRFDSISLTQRFGHPPVECYVLRLPQSVTADLGEGRPPRELAPMWLPGTVPVANQLGGDGLAHGPALAAAWNLVRAGTGAGIQPFLGQAIDAVLAARPGSGHQPGSQPLTVILRAHIGSSTGPGSILYIALALYEELRRRQRLATTWRTLIVTLPDTADGFGEQRLRDRQATALGLLLSLDALTARRRKRGSLEFEVGGQEIKLAHELVDELVLFGGGQRTSLAPQDVGRVVAHATALLCTRGTGVGLAVEDHQTRLRVLREVDFETGHCRLFGTLGAFEIRLDKVLAADRLGRRFALSVLELLMGVRPGNDDAQAQRSLWDRLADAVAPDGPGVFLDGQLDSGAVADLEEAARLVTGTPDDAKIAAARTQVEHRAQALSRATGAVGSLQARLERIVDETLRLRLLDGRHDLLAEEMSEAQEGLRAWAAQLREEGEQNQVRAAAQLEQAEGGLFHARSDADLDAGRHSHREALKRRGHTYVRARLAESLAGVLEHLSELFGGSAAYRLSVGLRQLRAQVAAEDGALWREVHAADWNALQRPAPTLLNLWQPAAEQSLFAHLQPLFEEDALGELRERPDALHAVLGQVGARLLPALRDGRADEAAALLVDYGRDYFARELASLSLSDFLRKFAGGVQEALEQPLREGWDLARGWVQARDDVRQGEPRWLIEVPAGDPGAQALYDAAARHAPESVAPERVEGDRGNCPALILYHSMHGWQLPELARLGKGGDYPEALRARERDRRDGRAASSLADLRFTTLIEEAFPAEWSGTFTIGPAARCAGCGRTFARGEHFCPQCGAKRG